MSGDSNACECATGLGEETRPLSSPIGTFNPAGRTALRYRLGAHGDFKEAMIVEAAAEPGLARHTTRDPSSAMNGFLDTTAYLLDILCFYNEVILNEGYLATATERVSLLELARSIGYELNPGVAATTKLAFDVEIAPGMPETVAIEPGIQVQNIPLPGEEPRIFETIEEVEALPAWNQFPPKQTRPQVWAAGKEDVSVSGVGFNLPLGSRLLVLYAPLGEELWETVEIADVEEDFERKVTRYTFSRPLEKVPAGSPPEGYPRVFRFTSEARVFGSNAPNWRTLPIDSKRAVLGLAEGASIPVGNRDEWPNFVIHLPNEFDSRFDDFQVVIDAASKPGDPVKKTGGTKAGSGSVADTGSKTADTGSKTADTGSKTAGAKGKGGKGSENLIVYAVATPVLLYFAYRASTLSLDQEYKDVLTDSLIYLDDPAGEAVLEVQGVETISRSAFALSGKSTIITADDKGLAPFRYAVRSLTVLVGSDELTVTEETDPGVVSGATVRLDSTVPELAPGRTVSLEGIDADSGDDVHLELTVKSVAPSATEDAWEVTFAEEIEGKVERASAIFRGNLAPASHGRSIVETPGHGDGRQRWMEVTLAQSPLTHLSSATHPRGIASTLNVSVDGIEWGEADFFYGAGPGDEIYTVRHDDDGTTRIRFGDGVTGMRVPTGLNNIKAGYRADLGAGGNLDPGRLINLMSRPLGLQGVHQPLIADGGEDPESREDARANAPLTVKTLDRLVSLSDYGDFARAYAGIAKANSVWGRFGQNQGVLLTIAGVDGAEVPDGSDLGRNFRESLERHRDPTVPFEIVNHVSRSFSLTASLYFDGRFDEESIKAEAAALLETRYCFAAMQLGEAVASSEIISLLQAVPGVAGVDLDSLHFSDRAVTREARLPALRGQIDRAGTVFPAELLTLELSALSLDTIAAEPG